MYTSSTICRLVSTFQKLSVQLSRHVSLPIGISIRNLRKFDKGVPADNATWVEFLLREGKVCAPGEGLRVTDGLRESVQAVAGATTTTTHIVALYLEKDADAAKVDFIQEGRYLGSVKVSVRVQIRSFERDPSSERAALQRKENSMEATLDFC